MIPLRLPNSLNPFNRSRLLSSEGGPVITALLQLLLHQLATMLL